MAGANSKCPFYRGVRLIHEDVAPQSFENLQTFVSWGKWGEGVGGGIFTIQTSVKSHDLEELYLQLVFNKSL